MFKRIALIAVSILVLVPALALARGGGSAVRVTGHCDRGATSKLKLKNDDGRIAVEFEVDNNRAGTSWNVTLRHDGGVFFRGVRRTAGRSGSFTVERRIANRAGADRVSARAVGPRGAVCTASAHL